MRNKFEEYIESVAQQGFPGNEPLVAIMLPLLEEVATFHAAGKVAPLQRFDTLLLTGDCLDIDEAFVLDPVYNAKALSALTDNRNKALHITGNHVAHTEVGAGYTDVTDALLLEKEEIEASDIRQPAYLTAYRSYEALLGHHDALTDIFWLGLVMMSVATGLNLYDPEDCRTFVANRNALVRINASLHPSIANLIEEMTELDRGARCRDLQEVISKLKNFRNYNPEQAIDLTTIEAYRHSPLGERRKVVLQKLRSRLFDTSRRNRLLYFKSNMRFLNLTVASFPLSLNLNHVKPEHLFYWQDAIAQKVSKAQNLHLNAYLRAEESLYSIPALDKIRLETQKDINEYGMSQLRLAVAFLHWYNLKEDARERISTPLVLVPVSLKKKKSLRKEDDYLLEFEDTEAEINPILRYMLEETYNIKLPERIDLETTNLTDFYRQLQEQVEQSRQGIKIVLVDKPRIKLIHNIAQRTANTYAQKIRQRQRGMQSYSHLDYSYEAGNFQPLGLQLFRSYIAPEDSYLERIIGDAAPKPLRGGNLTQEKETYMHDEGTENPYHWEFDLCHMVLGNFNYRKMSLVRDYNEALETGAGQHIFDQLFAEEARKITDNDTQPLTGLAGQYTVVPGDPTQLNSVLRSRGHRSYIIQGPPGTGKSQTITNLIADFIANGKKVLFVCEKMAAVEVVYHRLKSKGLHEMCCLIHDSQGDKKNMIADLKATYDTYLAGDRSADLVSRERHAAIAALQSELDLLEELHRFSAGVFETAGKPVYLLWNRLLQLQEEGAATGKPLSQNTILPGYKAWLESGDIIQKITAQLQRNRKDMTLSEHPVRFFNTAATRVQHLSVSDIGTRLRQLDSLLDALCSTEDIAGMKLPELKQVVSEAEQLRSFAQNDNLQLLDPNDNRSRELEAQVAQIGLLRKKLAQVQEQNKGWTNKLPEQELKTALEQVERLEHSFFKFLNGTWRRVKKVIRNNYDFSVHQVQPAYSTVIRNLLEEYQLQENYTETETLTRSRFRLQDLDADWARITEFRSRQDELSRERIRKWKEQPGLVLELGAKARQLTSAEQILSYTWNGHRNTTLETLQQQVDALLNDLGQLPELLHYLEQLDLADPELQRIVRQEPVQPQALELQLLEDTLQKLYRQYAATEKLTTQLVDELSASIAQKHHDLLEINARYIRSVHRHNFREKLLLTEKSASVLSAGEKELKKVFLNGRKVLEHEFSKTRRYKSIRELADGDTGIVLREIKPVWLMSPLSVSDALPLADSYFDVVIFDEASQITLEEGIPPMFRATKSIIVGDEMQMPPTNFFSAGNTDPDDLNALEDTEEEQISLDADSLLTQGARKLEHVMLGWHYRSRNESLISYSNAAFYQGALLTIPDRKMFPAANPQIIVQAPGDAQVHAAAVFQRSISYHYLPKGLYDERKNADEAAYIAELVRAILQRNSGKTIGIVAFSMEQQGQIEDALYRLQQQDAAFDTLVEQEYQRTDEGHFTGLFVKNLENVQGEERDIILISTCYGYNAQGRMYMNFGPINRKGGEKRLNVIFSRAKNHVVVVSSIKHTDIKNDYNDGARYFARYLQYAEHISNGATEQAAQVLSGLHKRAAEEAAGNNGQLRVSGQIAAFLREQGWLVASDVGQSLFKCSLAVRKEGDHEFRLGILVDDERHYGNANVFEQYVQRPAIMRSFGWKVQRILTKDWIYRREAMQELLLQQLAEA